MDGLEDYAYPHADVRFNPNIMQGIRRLEGLGQELQSADLSSYVFCTEKTLLAFRFLSDLEEFLASTSESVLDYSPFRSTLSKAEMASCLWLFQRAPCRASALAALKPLVNASGAGVSLGSLRSITAIARLIRPLHWATLSWRVVACVGFDSISRMRDCRLNCSQDEMFCRYLHVSDASVLDAYSFMERELKDGISTVSEVSMALYNLSLAIWPMELPFDRD